MVRAHRSTRQRHKTIRAVPAKVSPNVKIMIARAVEPTLQRYAARQTAVAHAHVLRARKTRCTTNLARISYGTVTGAVELISRVSR